MCASRTCQPWTVGAAPVAVSAVPASRGPERIAARPHKPQPFSPSTSHTHSRRTWPPHGLRSFRPLSVALRASQGALEAACGTVLNRALAGPAQQGGRDPGAAAAGARVGATVRPSSARRMRALPPRRAAAVQRTHTRMPRHPGGGVPVMLPMTHPAAATNRADGGGRRRALPDHPLRPHHSPRQQLPHPYTTSTPPHPTDPSRTLCPSQTRPRPPRGWRCCLWRAAPGADL